MPGFYVTWTFHSLKVIVAPWLRQINLDMINFHKCLRNFHERFERLERKYSFVQYQMVSQQFSEFCLPLAAVQCYRLRVVKLFLLIILITCTTESSSQPFVVLYISFLYVHWFKFCFHGEMSWRASLCMLPLNIYWLIAGDGPRWYRYTSYWRNVVCENWSFMHGITLKQTLNNRMT